jgi:hypothetical protein
MNKLLDFPFLPKGAHRLGLFEMRWPAPLKAFKAYNVNFAFSFLSRTSIYIPTIYSSLDQYCSRVLFSNRFQEE